VVKLENVLRRVSRAERVDPSGEYRLLGVRLDGNGPFLRETVAGARSSASTLSKVEAGDFIYSRLFAWRGAFGVVPAALHGCHASGEFPTFLPKPNRIDVDFLRYWFRLRSTLDRVGADCAGSTPLTRNRFKEHFFLALEMPLPPLEEQRRIVATLDAISGRAAEVGSLRDAVASEVASLTVSLHVAASGSEKVPLGEILELEEHREVVSPDGEYPQVGIRGFGGGLFAKPAVRAGATTYRAFNRLFEGAVVLSQVKGWEGAIDVCPPALAGWFASPEYRTFRCVNDKLRPEYAAKIFKTPWFLGQLSSLSRGVGARRERTRPEAFLALRIPLPSYERQGQLLRVLARDSELRGHAAQVRSELDALMPALLDRAFRGGL
jgi:type I restriction enzyme S subunit